MTMPDSFPVASQFDHSAQQRHAATLGLWIFLATELLFFGPLFFGYFYGRTHFPDAFAAAGRHTDVVLGSVNTALLLTSSVAMVVAVEARKLGCARTAMRLLWITALLGTAFLVLKGVEYRKEWQEHLFPGAAFSFPDKTFENGAELFYLSYFSMTALHALHLLTGIAITVIFALSLMRRSSDFARAERLELAGLYWHFIDVIWIFLYPLLYLVGRSSG